MTWRIPIALVLSACFAAPHRCSTGTRLVGTGHQRVPGPLSEDCLLTRLNTFIGALNAMERFLLQR